MSGVDLEKANLSIANLENVNLTKGILIDSNLSETNLKGAILKEAILIRANLKNVILEDADLTEAIFDEKQIEYLEKKYDLSRASVYLRTDEIISYKDYKETKGRKL